MRRIATVIAALLLTPIMVTIADVTESPLEQVRHRLVEHDRMETSPIAWSPTDNRWTIGLDTPPLGVNLGDQLYGGEVIHINEVIDFIEVLLPPGAKLPIAAGDAGIRYVEKTTAFKPIGIVPDDPLFVDQYGKQRMGFVGNWPAGFVGGAGGSVCIVDTGVRITHQDLVDRFVAGTGFDDQGSDVDDEEGHGTHVAGIAAATVDNGLGVAGAGNLDLYAVDVFDSSGFATTTNVASGISWCAVNAPARTVINLSLGSCCGAVPTPTQDAMDDALAANQLVVASAGNGYCWDCVGSPARSPSAIAVSCTSTSDDICDFSSTGPEVEIAAPGHAIISASATADDAYVALSGTSMSAPQVTGLLALYWSMFPAKANTLVRADLQASAVDLGPFGRDDFFGFGRADAHCLLNGIKGPATPCPVPDDALDLCGVGTGTYICKEVTHAFEDISSTGAQIVLRDDMSRRINLRQSFPFDGNQHFRAYLSSNGFLQFEEKGKPGTIAGFNGLPRYGVAERAPSDPTVLPNSVIAGVFSDLDPSAGGNVYFERLGAGSALRSIFQFDSVPEFAPDPADTDATFTPGTATFQIALLKVGAFELRYHQLTNLARPWVAGVEGRDGMDATYAWNQPHGPAGNLAGRTVRMVPEDHLSCSTPLGAGLECRVLGLVSGTGTRQYQTIVGTGTPLGVGDESLTQVTPSFTPSIAGDPSPDGTVVISDNGIVHLDAASAAAFQYPSYANDPDLPNAFVAPLWADLDPSCPGAEIWYQDFPAAPGSNGKFVVEWQDVPIWDNGACAGPGLSAQVIFVDTGAFAFHYPVAEASAALFAGVECFDPTSCGGSFFREGVGGIFQRTVLFDVTP